MLKKQIVWTALILTFIFVLGSCQSLNQTTTDTDHFASEPVSESAGTQDLSESDPLSPTTETPATVVYTTTYTDRNTNGVYLLLSDNGVFKLFSVKGYHDYFGTYNISDNHIEFTLAENWAEITDRAPEDVRLVFDVIDDTKVVFRTGESSFDYGFLYINDGEDHVFELDPSLCYSS